MLSVLKRCLHVTVLFSYLNLLMVGTCAANDALWELSDYSIKVKKTCSSKPTDLPVHPAEGLKITLKRKVKDTVETSQQEVLLKTFIPYAVPFITRDDKDFIECFIDKALSPEKDGNRSVGVLWKTPYLPGLELLILWDGSLMIKGTSLNPYKNHTFTFSCPGTIGLQDVHFKAGQFKAQHIDIDDNVHMDRVRLRLQDGNGKVFINEQGSLSTNHLQLDQGQFHLQGNLSAAGQGMTLEVPSFKTSEGSSINAPELHLRANDAALGGALISPVLSLDVARQLKLESAARLDTVQVEVQGQGTLENHIHTQEGGFFKIAKELTFNHFQGAFLNQGVLDSSAVLKGYCQTFVNHSLLASGQRYELAVHRLVNGPAGQIHGAGSLSLAEGENHGLMSATGLKFEILDQLHNHRTLKFHHLAGPGHLTNSGLMIAEGTDQQPALVDMTGFTNISPEENPQTGQVVGTHLTFTDTLRSWSNDRGQIHVENLVFQKALNKLAFVNKGLLKSAHLAVHNDLFTNSGEMTIGALHLHGLSFSNSASGKVTVSQPSFLDTRNLLNAGEWGFLSKVNGQASEIINQGQMQFQGQTALMDTVLQNKGTVLLESMAGFREIQNAQTLVARRGLLASSFINSGQADIYKALNLLNDFQNTGKLNILDAIINIRPYNIRNDGWLLCKDSTIPESPPGFYEKPESAISKIFLKLLSSPAKKKESSNNNCLPPQDSLAQEQEKYRSERKKALLDRELKLKGNLKILNYGTLVSQNSVLHLDGLINHNKVELHEGTHEIGCVDNHKDFYSKKSLSLKNWLNEGLAEIHGSFNVKNYFENTGEMSLVDVCFTALPSIEKAGNMNKPFLWSNLLNPYTPPKHIYNQGQLYLENTKSLFSYFHLLNKGTLTIKGDRCVLARLVNQNKVEFLGEKMVIDHLINYHQIFLFGQKWHLHNASPAHPEVQKVYTEVQQESCNGETKVISTKTSRPEKKERSQLVVRQFINKGEIAAEGKLTFEHPHLPGKLFTNGSLTLINREATFTPETLSDLKIGQDQKLKLYARDFEVNENTHLDIPLLVLHLKGRLFTKAMLKVGALEAYVDGPFIGGLGNTQMGGLETDKGPLTLEASAIDARFPRIYGSGATEIAATQGNVEIGSLKEIVTPSIRIPTNTLTNSTYQRKCLNGAYISSNSTVRISAPNANIYVDYGEIFSNMNLSLAAEANTGIIRALTGKIRSTRDISFFGNHVLVKRPDLLKQPATSCDGRYFDQLYYLECADPATLQAGENIHFNLPNVSIENSDVLAGKGIYKNRLLIMDQAQPYNGIFNLVSRVQYYTESQHGVGNHYHPDRLGYTPARLLAGERVHILQGSGTITGTLHALNVNLNLSSLLAECPTLRRDDSRHFNMHLTIDLDAMARSAYKNGAFLKVLENGQVGTDRLITGGITPGIDQMVYFQETPQTSIPRFSMDAISLEFILQQALAQQVGTLSLDGLSGRTLLAQMFRNAQLFRKEHGLMPLTPDTLKHAEKAFIAFKAKEVAGQIMEAAQLLIPSRYINAFKQLGDVSGDYVKIHTTENQTHNSNRVYARKLLSVFSEKKLTRQTLKKTYHEHWKGVHTTREEAGPTQQFICDEGDVNAVSQDQYHETGTKTQAGHDIIRGSTEKDTVIEDLTLTTTVTGSRTDGDFISSQTTHFNDVYHQHLPSSAHAGRDSTILAGGEIRGRAPQESAGRDLSLESKDELKVDAHISANQTARTTTESSFGSTTTISNMSQQPEVTRALFLAGRHIFFRNKKATVNGTDLAALKVFNQTRQGLTLGPTLATLYSSSSVHQSGPFGSSTQGVDAGQEVQAKTRVCAQMFDSTESPTTTINVEWLNQPELKGTFEETYYHLKSWQTSYGSASGMFDPNIAAVVSLAVTIAVGYATGGVGLAAVGSTGLAMTEGALVTQLVAAGIETGLATLSSRAAVSLATHGNPLKTAEDLCSADSLKSLGVDILTTVLVGKGPLPGTQLDLFQHIKVQGLRAAVRGGLGVLIQGHDVGQSFRDALKSTAINSLGAWAAQGIGTAYKGKDPSLDYFTHKLCHGLLGATLGSFMSEEAAKGAIAGALGGMASEMIAEAVLQGTEDITSHIIEDAVAEGQWLDQAEFQARYDDASQVKDAANCGKIGAALVTLLAKQDVHVAIQTATNAVENNLIPAVIGMGLMAWEACDIYQTYEQEGAEAAAKKLGFTIGTAVIGGVAVKGAFILGSFACKTAGEAILHYKQAHPVFARLYDIAARGVANGIQKYKKLDAKLDAAWHKGKEKVGLGKIEQPITGEGFPAPDYSTPHAPYSLRIDPLTGKGPMHVDSNLFTRATSYTVEGAARNKNQFWQMWKEKYPDTLSMGNLELIKQGKAPKVDQQWIQKFPEHQNYLRSTLVHHHIEHGNLTTALPFDIHSKKPGNSMFHTNLGGMEKND